MVLDHLGMIVLIVVVMMSEQVDVNRPIATILKCFSEGIILNLKLGYLLVMMIETFAFISRESLDEYRFECERFVG